MADVSVSLLFVWSDTDASTRPLPYPDGPLHDVSLTKASPCALGHQGQQMEADEPQMAKSTTTTSLALLLGGHPSTHCRPLLESPAGRLGLASASHLHVGAPRLPFSRYKCILKSPVSATKHTDSIFISSQLWTAGWTRCRIFLLLRTSLSSPRRSLVETPRQCLQEAWRHAIFAIVSYWPPSTTKPWTEWACVW